MTDYKQQDRKVFKVTLKTIYYSPIKGGQSERFYHAYCFAYELNAVLDFARVFAKKLKDPVVDTHIAYQAEDAVTAVLVAHDTGVTDLYSSDIFYPQGVALDLKE